MDISYLLRQSMGALPRFHPDRPALSLETDATLTYRQLYEASNRAGNALLDLGVQPGDRVAILLHNCLEYWMLYFGATRIGATVVRLNFRLKSAELEYALTDSGATVVCSEPLLLARLQGIRDRLGVTQYVSIETDGADAPDWCHGWSAFAEAAPDEPPVPLPRGDQAAMIMYTSGTTGRPKGALWTHDTTAWCSAMQVLEWRYAADTTHLVPGPMYHVSGIEAFASPVLLMGGHVVTLRSGGFDIHHALRIASEHRVTDMLLFPYMISEMLASGAVATVDLSSLRRIITGGDPLLPSVTEALDAQLPGVDVVQNYGLTEGTPVACCTAPGDAKRHPGTVGRPPPFAEVTVRDDAGAILPVGEEGEIWTRSPAVAVAYWQNPSATAETMVDGGWCRTGDAGIVGPDGLRISGRKKDMIRSGGENIYPAEVEDVLMRHDAIDDAAVVGVPDDRFVESVCAVVVRVGGSSLTEAEVIAHCQEQLAGYKKPRYVVFVDELPRNLSGKTMKYVLRDEYRDLPQRSGSGAASAAARGEARPGS
jgi:fatty-acyl-CoA synthase